MSRIEKFIVVLCLVACATLVIVNIQPLLTSTSAAVAPDYHLKYIANGVYHCTTDGSDGCDTSSSHVWHKVEAPVVVAE